MTAQTAHSEQASTWMLKGLPSRCVQEDVLDAISELGFAGTYDFFYMPVRRPYAKSNTFGYAFINFLDTDVALRFRDRVHNQLFTVRNTVKVAIVVLADIQGLQSLRDHFQRTAVMKCEAAPIFVGNIARAMRVKKKVVKETASQLAAPLLPGRVVADRLPERENPSVTPSEVDANLDSLTILLDTYNSSDAMQGADYKGEPSMPAQSDTTTCAAFPMLPDVIPFQTALVAPGTSYEADFPVARLTTPTSISAPSLPMKVEVASIKDNQSTRRVSNGEGESAVLRQMLMPLCASALPMPMTLKEVAMQEPHEFAIQRQIQMMPLCNSALPMLPRATDCEADMYVHMQPSMPICNAGLPMMLEVDAERFWRKAFAPQVFPVKPIRVWCRPCRASTTKVNTLHTASRGGEE
eukprot:TRINITY_DN13027_c0_g2_i1.p1 TRINITY_DN13027_c0_g2~~TRINITY_DN13027_c0_g2_i1.p1  ORF type:complete len:409 (+),score=68.48 TRINITY_DN13027_c0_g2_i1:76-1302(+)